MKTFLTNYREAGYSIIGNTFFSHNEPNPKIYINDFHRLFHIFFSSHIKNSTIGVPKEIKCQYDNVHKWRFNLKLNTLEEKINKNFENPLKSQHLGSIVLLSKVKKLRRDRNSKADYCNPNSWGYRIYWQIYFNPEPNTLPEYMNFYQSKINRTFIRFLKDNSNIC